MSNKQKLPSAELIFVTIRSTTKHKEKDYVTDESYARIYQNEILPVRNAAKLAVYDEIKIKVKNHQTEPTMRPGR